jgi:PAS domain S-box-containing protein
MGTPPVKSDAEVERLIVRLRETEGTLEAIAAGEIDAVLDPTTAAPILLTGAQQAIVRSEARFRDLITRAPVIVAELAPDGTVLFTNDALRKALGVRLRDLVGRNWWTVLIPAHSIDAADALIEQLHASDVTGVELPLENAMGELRWYEWTSANHYTRDGSLQRVVLFGLDVTERRRADETARRLAQEQMRRAEAEAANKTKTEFLAVMSHELRTPLNAIAGYVELLELGIRGPTTPEQLEDLNRIRRSQRHLLGLINDVMNYARIEAGHVSFDVTEVSVREVLSTIEALTEPQVRAKGIAYTIEDCDPTVTVWGDREKVLQILINLVSNAMKFTDRGGEIVVSCTSDGHHVGISVRDTGRGVPRDKLSAIFEPFVQVNRQFTREQEGVGLGLAISRDLARGLHGNLTVESELGRGSRFVLELPVHPPREP